jgi:hypothetical protein
MKFFDQQSPSAEAVLQYAGIVAANSPGESVKSPDGIVALTQSFKYYSNAWDYHKHLRLRVFFDLNFQAYRAVVEEARIPIYPTHEQRQPENEDFRSLRVIYKDNTQRSREESLTTLARLKRDLADLS